MSQVNILFSPYSTQTVSPRSEFGGHGHEFVPKAYSDTRFLRLLTQIYFSFTAINVTGERLSHAVGYAFKACLAKKKEIEKANQTLSQESNFPYKEKSVDVQSPGKCYFACTIFHGIPTTLNRFVITVKCHSETASGLMLSKC